MRKSKCALKAPKVTDCSAVATFQVCMHALEETALTEWKVLYFRGEQRDEDLNWIITWVVFRNMQKFHLRSRGEISQTQNTCEATGGSERFSAMIVFIVPAMVFLPSSRLSRRPDFSTKNTATVSATHKKKKTDIEVLLQWCTTTCISIYTTSRLEIISSIVGHMTNQWGDHLS